MSIGPGMLKVDTHSQPAAPPTPLGHGVGAPSTSAASSASGAIKELIGLPVLKDESRIVVTAMYSATRTRTTGFVKITSL
jgi:hypothetical protein